MNINSKIIFDDVEEIAKEFKNYRSKLKNKKIIITGGAGFLLSYFCDLIYVFNSKYQFNVKLIVYDKFVLGFPNRLKKYKKNNNIKFINKDLSKKFRINTGCDYLIHGASIASPIFYRKHPIDTIKVNVLGLINILDTINLSVKKPKSIIFMSSSEVYGNPSLENIPTKEDYNGNVSFIGPRACYDESKRIGETICVNYFNKYKLPIKIIRPFNVFGPGQNLNDKRIIPDIIKGIIKKKITLYSDGSPKRSFCYISDQIRGILNILINGRNGQAYNIGNDEMISIRDVTKSFIANTKHHVKLEFKINKDKNYTVDNPQNRCPNLSKAKKVNNWKPITKTKKGILRTLQYYKLN